MRTETTWLLVCLAIAACSDGSVPLDGGSSSTGSSSSSSGGGDTVSGGSSSGGSMASTSNGGSSSSDGSSSDSDGSTGSATTMATDGGSGSGSSSDGGGLDPYSGPFHILVLSQTGGYHHDSIPADHQMLRDLGQCIDAASCAKNVGPGHLQGDTFISAAKPNSSFDIHIAGCAMGATLCTSDNPMPPSPAGCCEGNSAAAIAEFTDANLAKYQLIYFANPTGPDFSSTGAVGQTAMAAIQKFIQAGGGYAGTHSATDFEQGGGFQFYEQEMTGGRFKDHNVDGTAGTVIIAPNYATHPVVQGLPANWATQDEWYCQTADIESNTKFNVLATLTGPAQPADCPVMGQTQRPVFWVREFPAMDGAGLIKGRTFYTVQGHNILRYREPDFRRLMHQAVLWAAHRLE